MRVSRAQAAAHRKAVIASAARLIRERGFDKPSIADFMKAAGLTHGGFYRQFRSKEALEREAFEQGVEESVTGFVAAAKAGPEGFLELVDGYLSAEHRDNKEDGCSVGALSPDLVRGKLELKEILAEAVRRMAAGIAEGQEQTESESAAIQSVTTMLGALMLSRAVVEADPALSDEILRAARQTLRSQGIQELDS
ncbi:TetR/AcrR family transcriptional regulator [Frondihabitans peucedani]|uniref:TetR/AcrR family transcriptional regulator n=1 Tax=Frondihabitans peucedani TaxID=598626 RepID=A0ABP8E1C2_9MICO